MRDQGIDIAKGIAILLVYLGHSILYYPIQMAAMYGWCNWLDQYISAFNMPMFFIISGFLFAGSNKSNMEVLKNKAMRLLVPYLSTMAILVIIKNILPNSLAYNKFESLWGDK